MALIQTDIHVEYAVEFQYVLDNSALDIYERVHNDCIQELDRIHAALRKGEQLEITTAAHSLQECIDDDLIWNGVFGAINSEILKLYYSDKLYPNTAVRVGWVNRALVVDVVGDTQFDRQILTAYNCEVKATQL